MKAIALDLDGTLLNDEKKVLKESKEILRKLYRKGIDVILVTGRSYAATKETLKDLDLPITAICYNGGKVIKYPEEKVIFEENLKNEVSQKLVKISRENKIHLNLYMNEIWSVENGESEISKNYSKNSGLPITVIDFTKIENIISTKALMICETDKSKNIVEILKNEIGRDANIISIQDIYFEIIAKDINKGKILEKILLDKGLSISQCIAFGDGENDIEMLSMAGIGVVMKNGVDDLKKIIKIETEATNNDGGIHKFLENQFKDLLN